MKNKEGGIIYGVRCTANQKWYIGQTIRGIEKRRQQHLIDVRNNYDSYAFHAAIRKYGEEAFDWTVLEFDIHTYDELNEREKYWIQEKNSRIPNGYNMNAGGNGTPNHRKNFVAWNKGKTGCYTEEALRRMSEGQKGRRVSEEQRKKISETLRGRHLSEETIRKRSAAVRGKHHSMEWRKHISESHKGKKLSEETKEKISATKRGKKNPHSEEHHMNLTNAIRKRCSKPVLMYNRDGDFIAEFPSLTAAADHIGVKPSQVGAVLRGKHKTAGGGYDKNAGYTFRYKNENPDR